MTRIAEIYESMEYGPAPESSALAHAWIQEHQSAFGHFVGGEWIRAEEGESFDTVAPATGEVLARISQADAPMVDQAVRAARRAHKSWSGLSGEARARHLYAIARHIQKNARLLAVLETLDNGKPVRESRDLDIPLVARHFYHHAGWATLMERELPGYRSLGVVGQIIPWNFPMLMLAWKVAPALAMGNTVVLKPAEYTSLTALLFADICRAAGLPAGVVNIITGDGRTGADLVAHDDVDKIAFTGSTEVGRLIREQTAGTGKRLSLELGGKSPFLVYDDADLDSVVEGVVDAIWFNQGQVCCAGSRILVQEGVEAELERKLKARMEQLRMGDPLDKSIDMGAIVADVQLDRITRLVEKGRSEGAEVWHPSWAVPSEGWFYPPTLCTGVQPAGTLAQVEIFGPVVVMMTFRTPAESVAMANDTRYGLAASVWTENLNLALDIAPRIKAGTVWVNCTNLFDAASGFGGYRESGFGREGGREGLWEYVRPEWEHDGAPASYPETGGPAVADSPPVVGSSARSAGNDGSAAVALDRTPKLFVGGNQVRPDGGYSLTVRGSAGRVVGEVGRGNRKDIRNAVEAAHAGGRVWRSRTAHNRAQVLYYLAENLSQRSEPFVARLQELTGCRKRAGKQEVEVAVRRLLQSAAWADKWEGRIHSTPFRNVTLAMLEPMGVIGIVCPNERPLAAFVSLFAPALATGNAVIVIPSEAHPLVATDFYQVVETSDVPPGVLNIVTGLHAELLPTLAGHDDVPEVWHFGDPAFNAQVERLSAGNMKRTWTIHGPRKWLDDEQGEGPEFLRRATQVKNIWVPYGE